MSETPPQFTPQYAQPQPKTSGLAMASMIVGIASIPLVCIGLGILMGPAALIMGIIALVTLNRPGNVVGGKGYAITGIVTGGIACVAIPGLLVAILIPSLGRAKELANRAACGANLSGVGKAFCLYGAENGDTYPTVTYAPYSSTLNNPMGVTRGPTSGAAYDSYFGASAQAGSPTGSLWMLVLKGTVSTRSFICKSDPGSPRGAELTNSSGNYYDNFGNTAGGTGLTLSYSATYPWTSDGNVADYWKNSIDASLPLASDVAPKQGTGSPAVDVTGTGKTSNSRNHTGGEGQNFVWGDAHVSFEKSNRVGQGGDNPFTYRGEGDAESVPGIPVDPAVGPKVLPPGPGFSSIGRADTVMMPVRDAGTYGF